MKENFNALVSANLALSKKLNVNFFGRKMISNLSTDLGSDLFKGLQASFTDRKMHRHPVVVMKT
jgi:hypothetical protein